MTIEERAEECAKEIEVGTRCTNAYRKEIIEIVLAALQAHEAEVIANRSVLESYLQKFKELSGSRYEIATSGFCEDVCNALSQRKG